MPVTQPCYAIQHIFWPLCFFADIKSDIWIAIHYYLCIIRQCLPLVEILLMIINNKKNPGSNSQSLVPNMICGLSCYLANATNWPILLLIKTFNSKSLQESSFSSWEDYFEILELRLLRPKKIHRSASYKCLQNNLQQKSRAIVHSSLDIVFA